MAELSCSRCGGSLTVTRGQTIILPSVTITEDPDELGYTAEHDSDGAWCGSCVEEMDNIIGGAA